MPQRSFVSARYAPAGRTYSFLLPELDLGSDPPSPPDGGFGAAGPPPPDDGFGAASPPPQPGDKLVVANGEGQAVATVVRVASVLRERREPAADTARVVLRRASRDDVVQRLKQEQKEQEARRLAALKIRERGLLMKLTKVEYLFDASRLIFYYTADTRVDFRELVRDLAAEFHMRIEMRQIGVRDEAKMLGGYGSCGRPLCCSTWLNAFEPVSIKMAKQQHLSLNPSKLSGQCGRLKCCLRYELPNGNGVKHAGCADHGTCSNPTGCGSGTCDSCTSCDH